MNIGDLVEWLITTDWGRRWVVFRAVAVAMLALFFTPTFIAILLWYAHWKANGVMGDLRHVLPSQSPSH
jgi:hypothetical protein